MLGGRLWIDLMHGVISSEPVLLWFLGYRNFACWESKAVDLMHGEISLEPVLLGFLAREFCLLRDGR